ncbi:MAG: CD225/dispanin family protein [Propionibacteriaceae bacterium]|nr:CD225/dispanin family protein [Propionibacteriaceae bacterium]
MTTPNYPPFGEQDPTVPVSTDAVPTVANSGDFYSPNYAPPVAPDISGQFNSPSSNVPPNSVPNPPQYDAPLSVGYPQPGVPPYQPTISEPPQAPGYLPTPYDHPPYVQNATGYPEPDFNTYQTPAAAPPSYGYGYPGQAGPPPDNYLVWAILSTILCCMPLGIASIVFSSQVQSKWAVGDFAGAQDSSQKAKRFAMIAAISGAVVAVLYLILVFGVGILGTTQFYR